jgi:hypothetical protein
MYYHAGVPEVVTTNDNSIAMSERGGDRNPALTVKLKDSYRSTHITGNIPVDAHGHTKGNETEL